MAGSRRARSSGDASGSRDEALAAISPSALDLSPEERARLARKGEILYSKSCGSGGRGTCAESFAVHHLRQGRIDVVRDLLRFLEGRIVALRSADPDGRLPATEVLAARIRGHLRVRSSD
jgi:hypothetical protein